MRQAVLPLLLDRTICTGMWRVAGSSLRLLSTVQPSMSGRKMSSVIAVGRILPRQRQRRRRRGGDDALEALVARQAEQDARVVRVVVDDQQDVCRPARCRRDRRRSARPSRRRTGSDAARAAALRRRVGAGRADRARPARCSAAAGRA